MVPDEQTLLVPNELTSSEVSLMVLLAANYRLKLKVVNFDGTDITKRVLSEKQLELFFGFKLTKYRL